MSDFPGGRFHTRKRADGLVIIECPPVMVVPPSVAIEMAHALLKTAGVEIVLAEPGQTVIRPPQRRLVS